jgi:pentatricopeptide repeat protein
LPRSVHAYTAAVSALERSGDAKGALALVDEMDAKGVRLSLGGATFVHSAWAVHQHVYTFCCLLFGCCKLPPSPSPSP